LTVPVRVPCAKAREGSRTAAVRIKTAFNAPRMVVTPSLKCVSTTGRRVSGELSGIQRVLEVFVNENGDRKSV
jgi:hypothetical protein